MVAPRNSGDAGHSSVAKSRDWHERFGAYPLSTVSRLNSTILDELRTEKQKPPDVVPTPFPTLNRVCMGAGGRLGLAHGWQVLIGSSSNKGKSTLAYNFAYRALCAGENVLYFALEADIEEIASRLVAIAGEIPIEQVTRGQQFDIQSDATASRLLLDLPGSLFLTAEPIYELKDIGTVVEAQHEEFDCRTIIIDHLQLTNTGNDKAIFDRVSEITCFTRRLAVRRNLLVLGLSQLNRRASRERDLCPTIHDLHGGTTLEADSNVVLLIDHCSKHYRYDPFARAAHTNLIIGKNRHGPPGEIPVRFDFATGRVHEVMPDEE